MPKKKKIDYGPFQPIVENYDLFISACNSAVPFEKATWEKGGTPIGASKLYGSKFLVIDFDVRPQRRVFEENFLRKFESRPFWEVVAARAVAKAVKFIFPHKHKDIRWEAGQSDWGYHGTMVLPSGGRYIHGMISGLYTQVHNAKRTNVWTKKALKYETGNPDGLALTVREPTSKVVFPMVAENFVLSNGVAPTWSSHNWQRLAEHLKKDAR